MIEKEFQKIEELIKKVPQEEKNILININKIKSSLEIRNFSQNKKKKEVKKFKSQTEIEREKVEKRLNGFCSKNSKAWETIMKYFGENLNQMELNSIAEVLSDLLSINLDREAKRRREVLIKWFDENFEKIEPYLKLIILEKEN